jgi:hypothetical protein
MTGRMFHKFYCCVFLLCGGMFQLGEVCAQGATFVDLSAEFEHPGDVARMPDGTRRVVGIYAAPGVGNLELKARMVEVSPTGVKTVHDLPALPGSGACIAAAISQNGRWIAGECESLNAIPVNRPEGTIWDCNTLPCVANGVGLSAGESSLTDINDSGTGVGNASAVTPLIAQPSGAGTWTLSILPGIPGTLGAGIAEEIANDGSLICGDTDSLGTLLGIRAATWASPTSQPVELLDPFNIHSVAIACSPSGIYKGGFVIDDVIVITTASLWDASNTYQTVMYASDNSQVIGTVDTVGDDGLAFGRDTLNGVLFIHIPGEGAYVFKDWLFDTTGVALTSNPVQSRGFARGDGFLDVVFQGSAGIVINIPDPLAPPPPPLTPFGMSVTGMTPKHVNCKNRATDQTVKFDTTDTTWNCEAEGLVTNPGDKVSSGVKGHATGSAITGSITGASGKKAWCANNHKKRKQAFSIKLNGATSWDCTAAGLMAEPGDVVVTGVVAIKN